MHESPEELEAMQALLDRSYAAAGPQLRRIHSPERRLGAGALAARLQGVCLLVLSTVSADGRPFGSPVDGIFYRGAFHFGSSPDALRLAHIRARPAVSATHLPGESFAVTVHGRAAIVEVAGKAGAALRRALLEVYVPRHGPEWETFLDSGPVYARIDAERMFALAIEPASAGGDGGRGA